MPISKVSDAYKVQRAMLRITGVWPEKDSTSLYTLRCMLSWILSTTLCFTMWLEIFNDVKDFTKVSETLYVTISGTIAMVKLFCLTYNRKSFICMIKLLEQPIFTSYPEEIDHYMAKTIRISLFLGKSYGTLCLCCMILFAVYPILDNKELPFSFPYDLGDYTYLMYIFQVISVNCFAWNTTTMDTLHISLLGIAAAQMDTLAAKIIYILNNDAETVTCELTNKRRSKTDKKLGQCVRHHVNIIQFIGYIEEIFSLAFFSQFLGSTLILCNTLFYFLLINEASSLFVLLVNYLIIIIIQLFMFCWFGNEVIIKSQQIADACYMSKWYKHENNVRKYLFIIMERSRRPVAVTVLKISNLSIDAFKSIIQWSYSCFALLLKVYKES